jgi:ligand-binding sensor domain-containing protein
MSLLVLLLATPSFAWMNFDLSQPYDTSLADNVIVDIIYDGTYVWLATGNGLSGTSDRGVTWRSFNSSNGFKRSSVSAMAAAGRRIWVATSHDTSSGSGDPVPAGGGLQITDDFGDNWRLKEPKGMSSPGKLAYDISVYDSSVWIPAFYGGLLRSLDFGENWENVYVDSSHKDDIENSKYALLTGRHFSTVVDPYHQDSVIVWAGSAGGVQRFYYISKRKKLAGDQINDIAYDGRYFWYGTERGLSKFNDSLYTFLTYDSSNGFPGNHVNAVGGSGELVCAGVYDTLGQRSLGFMVSTDGGTNWTPRTPPQGVGADRMIGGIAIDGNDIWAACGKGGLIRSSDNGVNWQNYYLNPSDSDTLVARNVYNCIDVGYRTGFTRILAGTDSGIVIYYFKERGTLDSTVYLAFPDTATYSRRIISIAGMVTEYGDEIWAAARPSDLNDTLTCAVLRSTDRGLTWKTSLMGPPPSVPTDIEILSQFQDTLVWVGTTKGMRLSSDFGRDSTWGTPALTDYTDPTQYIGRTTPILAVEGNATRTHCGSLGEGGASIRTIASDTDSSTGYLLWSVYKAQIDPYKFDYVGLSTARGANEVCSTCVGGNFIPALALQRSGDSTIIWAGTRSTDSSETNAVSITTDRGRTWRTLASDIFAWNMDFNGDTAFVATSGGLLMTTDFGATWETLAIKEPTPGRFIDSLAEVYAVRYVNGDLWAGTSDGVAWTSDLRDWRIFRTYFGIPTTASGDDRTYVSPNPYSPYLSTGQLRFHYRLEMGGTISIKVYDFANNLVKQVVDGPVRVAGLQYDDIDLWDGRNEKGDKVAAGVYVYVIESSGGDRFWGKFMVIP